MELGDMNKQLRDLNGEVTALKEFILDQLFVIKKSREVAQDNITPSDNNQCITVRPSLSVCPFVHLLHFFYILLKDLVVLFLHRKNPTEMKK